MNNLRAGTSWAGFDAIVEAHLSDRESYQALLRLSYKADIAEVVGAIREAKLSTMDMAASFQAYYMRRLVRDAANV